MPDPRPALPRRSPSAGGLDPEGLSAFLDAIAREDLELHGLMVWQGGAVVAEGFWRPYGPDRVHMLHSATKSWTTTALGIAIGEGRVALTDRVAGLFPGRLPAAVSDNLAAMTVEDLLTMRTGHRTGISGGEWRGRSDSWVEAFLREPVEDPPGRDFMYSSATSYMVSAIVTAVTGRTLADYLGPRLFRPLGVAPVSWDLSPEGVSTGGNGLSLRLEDVLKFGILHLQDGTWGGERILPAGWVAQATRNQVAEAWLGDLDACRFKARGEGRAETREGYGYGWWMTRDGGYRASGNHGQQCIVLPRHDAVVALFGGLAIGEKRHMEALWAYLVPALAAGGGKAETAALELRLAGLALPQPAGAACSPLERDLDGSRWLFEPNKDGLEEAGFEVEAGLLRFTLRDARGTHAIAVGLGAPVESDTTVSCGTLHHGYQPDRMRVSAQGVWPEPTVLLMVWRFVEMAYADTVTCRFEGASLRFDRSVNAAAGALARPSAMARRTADPARRAGDGLHPPAPHPEPPNGPITP